MVPYFKSSIMGPETLFEISRPYSDCFNRCRLFGYRMLQQIVGIRVCLIRGFLHDLGSRWGLRLSFGLRFDSDQGFSFLVAMLLSFVFRSGGAEFSFVFTFCGRVLCFAYGG